MIFQEEIFELLPTQASEGDLPSSLDEYDYEHIRVTPLTLIFSSWEKCRMGHRILLCYLQNLMPMS